MPQITLVKGDIPIKDLTDNYVIVSNAENKDQFLTKNFDNNYPHKVIEASLTKVPVDTLRWIAAKSIYPVIMYFVDGKIPEGLNKTGLTKAGFKNYTNELITITGTVADKIPLFDMLEIITTESDRVTVFEMLEKNVSSHYIIMMYLISNVNQFEHNRPILEFIDIVGLFKSSRRVSELLAFCFKPVNRKLFLKWNFPKKEDKE